MIDLQTALKTIIEAEWSLTDPSVKMISNSMRFDEFDPKFGPHKAGSAVCPTSGLEECTWDGCQTKWVCTIHTVDCDVLSECIAGIELVLEDFPSRRTYLCETSNGRLYRVDHSCKITLYVKPVNYKTSIVDCAKAIFRAIKTELDRIFAKKKFTTTGVSNLEMSNQGWDDKKTLAVGRGEKVRKEPIIWQSETIVVATYYIVG